MNEMPVARVRIEYKVWREGDLEPIVEGYTVHSFVNAETGKPTRAPQVFLETLDEEIKSNKEAHT